MQPIDEEEREAHRKDSVIDHLRGRLTSAHERERVAIQLVDELLALRQAEADAEQERLAKEAALAELDRLRAQLSDE